MPNNLSDSDTEHYPYDCRPPRTWLGSPDYADQQSDEKSDACHGELNAWLVACVRVEKLTKPKPYDMMNCPRITRDTLDP